MRRWGVRLRGRGVAILLTSALAVSGPVGAARAEGVGFADGNDIHVTAVSQIDARQVDVALVPSALAHEVHVRLLLPDGYDEHPEVRYPVLYLFHGTSGRASDWVQAGDAEATTAGLPVIVVMPDAGFDGDGGGWFTDWVDTTTAKGPSKWETFHVGELIGWVDANLRTVATREGRAIAGLSQGGFGSTTYPARHPDMFVSAASFSGAPDIDYNPADAIGATAVIEATAAGLDGVQPEAMFGSRVTDEINWQGHDPAELLTNLRGVDIWLYTATGAPGPLDPTPANPAAMGIETLTHASTLNFYQRALQLGIPVHLNDYLLGTHSFPYWSRDLREYVPEMMYDFSHPSAPPASVSYESIDQSWSQWGWSVSVQRAAAQEFSWLEHATSAGFTLSGTGVASVTTPASYEPGSLHAVTVSNGNASMVMNLIAEPDGRLQLTVPLGTVPPSVVIGVPVSPAPGATTTVTIA